MVEDISEKQKLPLLSSRKRNSICLETNDIYGNAVVHNSSSYYVCGNLSRFPNGSFRKTRRFTTSGTQSSQVSHLVKPPSFYGNDLLNSDLHQLPRRNSHRRSSAIIPKTHWEPSDNTFNLERWSSFQSLACGKEPAVCMDVRSLDSAFRVYAEGETTIPCFPAEMNYVKKEERFIKKGTWTEEEDEMLRKFGTMASTKNWTEIADNIPGRTAKQCRERWCFNLDPSIKKDLWTVEEDQILIEEQKKVGNKWAKIAQFLPGRTENAVKTRFKSILRAQKREWHPLEDEKLLQLFQLIGNNWEKISSQLGSDRTKHAVKMRFKELQAGIASAKPPEPGSARQTVRQTYYPLETIEEVSKRYQKLADKGSSTPLKTKASLASLALSKFPSFSMQTGHGLKQEMSFPFTQGFESTDPLDDMFNLCPDDDPLVFA